ncbi:MAG TPA: hypothetical protein P5136_01715 [Methanofastidiosum sp.]|nr:hypothetical protein [Methanofastidiosum sp.]
MKEFDEKEYEEFKKWIDANTNDVTNPAEALRIGELILDKMLSGERFINGKFKKVN